MPGVFPLLCACVCVCVCVCVAVVVFVLFFRGVFCCCFVCFVFALFCLWSLICLLHFNNYAGDLRRSILQLQSAASPLWRVRLLLMSSLGGLRVVEGRRQKLVILDLIYVASCSPVCVPTTMTPISWRSSIKKPVLARYEGCNLWGLMSPWTLWLYMEEGAENVRESSV